ncbi:MAG TPA: GNAT family N-acetyltransferase [Allosphingosinicella sp.]|nr:GNAT family N-acetyltransferase [Allosphingosinicella sp.]
MADPELPPLRLPERLTDGVVLLDAHRLEDAEVHLRGEDEEMRRRFDAARPATLAETRRAMRRWIDGRTAGRPMLAYALRTPSGLLMGGCELRMCSAGAANISYWLFPQFRGRGHALRAVALLCEAARNGTGLRRLEARIAPDNAPSRRVVEKAGFAEAGLVDETSDTGVTSRQILYIKTVE